MNSNYERDTPYELDTWAHIGKIILLLRHKENYALHNCQSDDIAE